MTNSHWWVDEDRPYRRVNGVFKGGGARGAAYAGALVATAGSHIWFDSVAGASAGAITATLVSAGIHPSALCEMTAAALRSVFRLAIHRPSVGAILSTGGLRSWLEEALREQVVDRSRDVTFDSLFEATGIGLYVIVMDLATRRPLVCCHELTGGISVSD